MSGAAFIGIDWGSTNLRGWLLDAEGGGLDARAAPSGAAGLRADDFAPTLDRLIEGWPALPVLACGMVGSRQGWIEAPYVPSPASAATLAAALIAAPGRPDVRIVPGVALTDADGALVDVMRGEETQTLGLDADDAALLLCPGTHAKWIESADGEIRDFQTFMTGELNALLGRHSVLRHSVGGEAVPDRTFLAAVREMLDGGALSAALFSVRVGSLDGRLSPAAAASRLSGLVIGAEIAAGVARFGRQPLSIIGDGGLIAFYATALKEAGRPDVRPVDGAGAVCRGLARIWRLAP
ncbi:MAG: 2-dehydro-3-deoxygalactonokinase [Brevundimonas sp.]